MRFVWRLQLLFLFICVIWKVRKTCTEFIVLVMGWRARSGDNQEAVETHFDINLIRNKTQQHRHKHWAYKAVDRNLQMQLLNCRFIWIVKQRQSESKVLKCVTHTDYELNNALCMETATSICSSLCHMES